MIHEEILKLIRTGRDSGRYHFSQEMIYNYSRDKFLCVAVSYKTVTDYSVIARVIEWSRNHSSGEALTPRKFREVYGHDMGEYFYACWLSQGMDVAKMISTFRYAPEEGQQFLNLIMSQVLAYEERIKKEENESKSAKKWGRKISARCGSLLKIKRHENTQGQFS